VSLYSLVDTRSLSALAQKEKAVNETDINSIKAVSHCIAFEAEAITALRRSPF